MSTSLAAGRRPILVFPGQGSYSRGLLRELFKGGFGFEPQFESADAHCRRMLGAGILEPIATASAEDHDRYLESNPDLDQVGIFLAAALVARLLFERGLSPQALLGHSLGDLAALASGGVFSIDNGVRIVCHRVLALQTVESEGRMAAVSTDTESITNLLVEFGASAIEVSVVNHRRQTVLSGPARELEALVEPLALRRISLTMLKSRYPFHSSHLHDAVRPFEIALRGYELQTPERPVFLSTEGRLLAPGDDLASLLARQFTTRLDFPALLRSVDASGRTFVECGDGGGLLRILGKNLDRAAGDRLELVDSDSEGISGLIERLAVTRLPGAKVTVAGRSGPHTSPEERCRELPVAVVAMGCVLPGAADPDTYWKNLITGISGITDLAELDPVGSADFLIDSPPGEPRLVSDKTYTLLNGAIPEVPYQPLLEAWYDELAFGRLTKGQQLLAVALAQCLSGSPDTELAAPTRIRCILGATADGFAEYDEAMVLAALRSTVERLDVTSDRKAQALGRLEQLLERGAEDASGLGPHLCLQQVVERLLPDGVRSFVVDTACSSSLYAINLGIKELARGSADLVFAGGVFAPGPANNTLFAQFRGLSPNGSRPLDAGADGVVFGDGAAIVVLKRLTDALGAGDRLLGVIRAMGLSSDGKSPSINVPRSRGQSLAMRRAYSTSGIRPRTIQYIEAHATATPVGDAVEFRSLRDVFGDQPPGPRRIELGSVKALIGHTGWVSGAASLIKILKAFEHRCVPPQHNYEKPQEEFRLDESPFTIAKEARPWPPNVDGLPRRAGINGFGFGGTNAHLVVEEFDANYHLRLSESMAPAEPAPLDLAVVAACSLFPDSDRLARPVPGASEHFNRGQLGLPAGKILLPDVVEHMDPSQFLAALSADQVLGRIAGALPKLEGDVAVVLGLESKTERGVRATQRIFLDRLIRLLDEHADDGWDADERHTLEAAIDRTRSEVIPSGPYTLAGLMPNVAASRISSLFDLQGPNMVVDSGPGSLLQAIAVGAELLAAGDCRLVLAGGINALGPVLGGHREGLVLLALTLPKKAADLELPVLFRLAVDASEGGAALGRCLRITSGEFGASGVKELVEALRVAEGGQEIRVAEPVGSGLRPVIRLSPTAKRSSAADAEPAHAYDFVEGTPIYRMTPRLSPLAAADPPASLAGRRILLLADQKDWWPRADVAGVVGRGEWTVVSPAGSEIPGSVAIDLENEGQAVLEEVLSSQPFDVILAVKDLNGHAPWSLIGDDPGGERHLLDLLFMVLKHGYRQFRENQTAVIGICLDAFVGSEPHPYSGLFAGLLKSVAREFPGIVCRAICLDERGPAEALRAVELELGQALQPVEVFHFGGRRLAHRLERLERLAADDAPLLDADSVVLATGGGRGVTAVLAEELLERFGCTVIGLGRTKPEELPAEIRAMGDDELSRYEAKFYREEMSRPGAKITEVKRRFAGYQAAHELSHVIAHFRSLRGHYEYRSLDIRSRQAVAALLEEVRDTYGRLDLVVHGAGLQLSQQLTKKSLGTFRQIVGTKLDGLAHIYRESDRIFGPGTVNFHLLTSAFSYLGNDGQPDYGAANEAMNRLAAVMGSTGGRAVWSSMAWLGWAGIGMTRGSEFAALAARRRLRGVTREEGRQIFGELMSGRPTAPVNVLLADGEIAFYEPAVAAVEKPARSPSAVVHVSTPSSRKRRPLNLTLDQVPFLLDHQVRGVPTLPGAFIICLAAEAALELRPEFKITSFQDTSFLGFVHVYPERDTNLHLDSEVISGSDDQCVVRVRLLSDFVHHTGVLLRENVVQTEIFVHLAAAGNTQPEGSFPRAKANGGRRLPDPYVMDGSPVRLKGRFVTMSDVVVENGLRAASFQLSSGANGASLYDYLLPNLVMVDAFWRFGTVQSVGRNGLAVYVPERCRRMGVFFDYGDFSGDWQREQVIFLGANPRERGDQLNVGPIEARTESGKLLLTVEGGVCRRFGVIDNAF